MRPRNEFLGYCQMSLRDKASDGAEIACRYTPEMSELWNVALELRRQGILES